jgi:hypothetical protein
VRSGGSFLTQRLALFPIYGLIIWIAAQKLPRSLLAASATAGLIIALGLGLTRLPTYQKLDSVVSDFMSVEPCLAPDSTMVQASMAQALPSYHARLDPVTDEPALLAADLHGIDLGSIEGSVPFYLLRYRPNFDSFKYLALPGQYIEGIPPPLDPLGYERRTHHSVDYVLLFGLGHADHKTLASSVWTAFDRELHRGYQLVAVSPQRWVQVWERAGSTAARIGQKRRLATTAPACHPAPRGQTLAAAHRMPGARS